MVASDEKVATPMDEAELENGTGGEEEEEEEEEKDEAVVGVPYAATWTHLSRGRGCSLMGGPCWRGGPPTQGILAPSE